VPLRSGFASATTGYGRTKTSISGWGGPSTYISRGSTTSPPGRMARATGRVLSQGLFQAGIAGGGSITRTLGFSAFSAAAIQGSTFGVCETFQADSAPTTAISAQAPHNINLSIILILASAQVLQKP